MSSSGLARVEADAAARQVAIEVVARPPADSLEQAAELLGLRPHAVVKTLMVKRHDGTYLFALVPGDRQISWPKLRATVEVNRLRMPEAQDALRVIGFERGTITPFGSLTVLPVFSDVSIVGERVALGAGAHGHSLLVDADSVIAAFTATVADITDPI